jgi:GR25 family glycosyltransferase involved in LPS biosynthesis
MNQHMQTRPVPYRGFYINLAESRDRNRLIRDHLQALGLAGHYERFEGVRGADIAADYQSPLNAGSIGCGLSHQRLLATHGDCGDHLHILEDDAILHPRLPTLFAQVAESRPWDLIFTDIYFSVLSPQNFQQFNRLIARYRTNEATALVNLRGLPFVGATSYFIHRNSIAKVADLLGTRWIRHCKHDTHINNLVQAGQLEAFAFMPFLSTRSALFEQSTIDPEYTSLMHAMDLQRAAFYADADLEHLRLEAGQLGPGGQPNPLVGIYIETTRSILEHIDQGIHKKPD